MARVGYVEKEDLAPEHRHVYDEIAARRGGVGPPYSALLNNPEAASRVAALGAYVRFQSSLSERTKKLAALTAARESEGEFVWTVQERAALSAGLEQEAINAIRERRAPQALNAEDAPIVQFALELLQRHRISEATFREVQERLGDAGVIDLIILIGHYYSLSHAMSALEVDLLPGVTSTPSG